MSPKLNLSFLLTLLPLTAAHAPLPTVPSVDLMRYSGKWFEIARLPNWFEKEFASDITANYTLRADGKIEVVNTCRKADGKTKRSQGTAKLRDSNGPNSQLKVTFFWPFAGDYWIIDLDPDYRWVLVGTPSRDYLWILSRTPQLNDKTLTQIEAKAKSLGFSIDQLVRPKHG